MKTRFTITQENAILSSMNFQKEACKNSYKKLIIIRGTSKKTGKATLVIYKGKSAKPIANYCYPTYERREDAVAEYKKTADSHEAYDLKKQAEKIAFNPSITIGDVYHDMWGYDQTNNTFYEVVEKCSKHYAMVREIGLSYRDDGGFMSGYSKCEPGNYVGDPFRVKMQKSGCKGGQYIKVRGYSSASLLIDKETEFTDTNYA